MVHMKYVRDYYPEEFLDKMEQEFIDLIYEYSLPSVFRRFRNMNASESEWLYIVVHNEGCRIKFLRSYGTIVALALEQNINENPSLVVVKWVRWRDAEGKCSRATAKQQALWIRELEKYADEYCIPASLIDYEAYETFDRW